MTHRYNDVLDIKERFPGKQQFVHDPGLGVGQSDVLGVSVLHRPRPVLVHLRQVHTHVLKQRGKVWCKVQVNRQGKR